MKRYCITQFFAKKSTNCRTKDSKTEHPPNNGDGSIRNIEGREPAYYHTIEYCVAQWVGLQINGRMVGLMDGLTDRWTNR